MAKWVNESDCPQAVSLSAESSVKDRSRLEIVNIIITEPPYTATPNPKHLNPWINLLGLLYGHWSWYRLQLEQACKNGAAWKPRLIWRVNGATFGQICTPTYLRKHLNWDRIETPGWFWLWEEAILWIGGMGGSLPIGFTRRRDCMIPWCIGWWLAQFLGRFGFARLTFLMPAVIFLTLSSGWMRRIRYVWFGQVVGLPTRRFWLEFCVDVIGVNSQVGICRMVDCQPGVCVTKYLSVQTIDFWIPMREGVYLLCDAWLTANALFWYRSSDCHL